MAKKVKVTDLKELNIADSDLAEAGDIMYLFMEVLGETPGTSKLVVPSGEVKAKPLGMGAGKFQANFKLKAKFDFGTSIVGISETLGLVNFELE